MPSRLVLILWLPIHTVYVINKLTWPKTTEWLIYCTPVMVKLSLSSINLLVKAPKSNFRTTRKKWAFWTSYFWVVLTNYFFVQTTNLNLDVSKCVNIGLISTLIDMIPVYCFEVQRKFLSRHQVFSIDDWTKEQDVWLNFWKMTCTTLRLIIYSITLLTACPVDIL